jgi:hypothetical protein
MRRVIIVAALSLLGCGPNSGTLPIQRVAIQPVPISADVADTSRLPAVLESTALSSAGLGPIQVGKSVDAFRERFNGRLEQSEPNAANESCAEWAITTSNFAFVSFRTYESRVSGLTIGGPVSIRTAEGIGIGSTAAEVRAAYPNAERRGAEYVPEPGHELFVWTDPENHVGLRFEIGEDERVTAIHAGGDLHNDEGCAGA